MTAPHELKSNRPARVVRFELAPSTMIILSALLGSLWLLFKLLPLLLMLIAAYFMVVTLNPVVRWLEGKRVHRGLAIAIVFGSSLVLTLGVAFLTVPSLLEQTSTVLEQEPILRTHLANWLSGFPVSVDLSKWLRNFKLGGSVSAAGAAAFTYSLQALGFIAYVLTTISLALYMMIDRDRLRGGLFAVIPRSHHIRLSRVTMNLETIVGAYIRGQVITSLSIGLFIFVVMIACGVENAMALSLFAAIADILPYIGIFFPVAAAILSAIPHGSMITMIVVVLMVLYMEFESRILVPKVYGQVLRLPSTVVLFSLLAGGILMGMPGALLALPFAAAAMMLLEELRVQLPGEQDQVADEVQREKDDKGEQEYERRTEGASATQSAAIAVEISGDRVKEEIKSQETEA